jgi:hypothetical protein
MLAQGMVTVQNEDAVDAAADALPVRVANRELARAIASGRGEVNIGIRDLENCAMIIPIGRFAWDRPDAGTRAGTGPTCVAEVEMRKLHGNTDIVLARALVAAGDSIECNIGHFPPEGYTAEADGNRTIFPADQEPSVADVRRALDREQRRNAGTRTATAAAIGAAGGAMLAPQGQRWQGAGIGAATAGGITYVSTQAGHIWGNVIMGTAVNATAGGLIANIMAVGSSTWAVDDCPEGTEGSCLFGVYADSRPLGENEAAFFNEQNGETMVCTDYKDCRNTSLLQPISINGTATTDWANQRHARGDITESGEFCLVNGNMSSEECESDNPKIWHRLDRDARIATNRRSAVLVGWTQTNKRHDWKETCDPANIHAVNPGGNGTTLIPNAVCNNFTAFELSADDGRVIDITHPGRRTATLIGAGVGGAMGGFAAYQGAQEELMDRWTAAVREYRASLQTIYCGTGTRLLAPYNSTVVIPNIRQ